MIPRLARADASSTAREMEGHTMAQLPHDRLPDSTLALRSGFVLRDVSPAEAGA